MTKSKLSLSATAALLAVLLLGSVLVSPAAAQVTAWGEGGGELFVVHLPGGAMNPVGSTGAANMEALALAPDGRVLGLVDTGSAAEIYELNTETGAATLLVSADQPGAVGLTVLEDGRVFLSVGQEIREVDLGTGSTTLLADLGLPVVDLADDGFDVIAWVADDIDGQLHSVDSTTGASALVRDGLIADTLGLMVSTDASIWYLALGGGVLAPPRTTYVPSRLGGHGAGGTASYDIFEYFAGDPRADVTSLAFRGSETLAEVPGPGPAGQFLLALLIVSAGWFVLIRR